MPKKKNMDDLFIVLPMKDWQARVLKIVARLIGFHSKEKIYVITVNKEYKA